MLRRNTASRLAIACLALTASVHAADLPGLPAAPSAPGVPAGVGAGAAGGLGAAPQLPALPALAAPAVDAGQATQPAPVDAAAEGSRSIGVDALVDSSVALPGLEGTQPLQTSTAVKRKLNVSYRVNASRAASLTAGDLPAPGAALAGTSAADVQVDVDGSSSHQLQGPANVAVGASDGALSHGVSLREQSALSALPASGDLPTVQGNRALKLTLDTRGQGGERSVSGKAGDTQQKLDRKARPVRQLQVEAESLPGSNRVETARH